jgi:hypothetical protein
MASQRYIYLRCQSHIASITPIGDQLGRSFFGSFCFLLSCSDSIFLFFRRRISSINGERRCSQNHELQSQSTSDKYKQLATAISFSLLNAINITSTVNLLAYELTLL